MSGKKVVNRKVMLGMAGLCIILLGITVGFLENQNRGLQSQVESEGSMIASLESSSNSTNNSLNALNTQVASLQNQVTSANTTNLNLQSQLTTKTSSLNSANSQVATLQDLLSFSNVNLKDDQNQVSSEQSTIVLLNAQIANLESTMANWDSPVTDGFSLIQISDTILKRHQPCLIQQPYRLDSKQQQRPECFNGHPHR